MSIMSQKQKIENILREDENTSNDVVSKRIRKCTLEELERFKSLENQLLKYADQRRLMFYLTDLGKHAEIKFPLTSGSKTVSPLFLEDIRNLLLYSVVGFSPFPLRWSILSPAKKVSKTVLFEISGLCEQDSTIICKELFKNSYVFPQSVEITSSHVDFATELSTLHLSTEFYNQAKQNYASLFPMSKNRIKIIKSNNDEKLNLLLKPIQLAMEGYPLPQNVFEQKEINDYCFSKDIYDPVTAHSPMFAIDCEMSLSYSGRQELVRIAIVNENLETIFHSFVKPKEKIMNYLTQFSGVTEEMLKDIKTTLSDVQREIKQLLPKDAILCGQSLQFDLHALKLIHPYVIDTSVIFSPYGIRGCKSSLKTLARVYLNEVIQVGSHNPVEDSVTAMKLVKFRLQNRLQSESGTFSNKIEHNGFFYKISEHAKRICLIGKQDSLKNYRINNSGDINLVQASSLKEIMKETINSSKSVDLTISHLGKSNFSVDELNDEIKEAYDNFPNRTLFVVIVSDIHKSKNENFKKNFAMIVLKTY